MKETNSQGVDQSDFQVLVGRVVRLEKQNRLLKWGGLCAFVMVGGFVFMGQATPKPRTVEANEFVVRDEGGRVWARLGQQGLVLYFLGHDETTHLTPDQGLVLSDPLSGGREAVVVSPSEGPVEYPIAIAAYLPKATTVAELNPGGLFLNNGGPIHPNVILSADEDGGNLIVSDSKGFKASLGRNKLENPRTGETSSTSAASLILFDKDKKVMWRAP